MGATTEKDRARLLTPPGNAHDLTALPEHNTPPPDPEEVRVAAAILEEDLPRRLRDLWSAAARPPRGKVARTCAHCGEVFYTATENGCCPAHRTKRSRAAAS